MHRQKTLGRNLTSSRAGFGARASVAAMVALMASPAASYQLIGATWDTEAGPSTYALHPDGSDDISDGSDLTAVRAAFDKWSCIEGSRFRFAERTDVDGVKDFDDAINSVFWDETGEFMLGPGTLGVATGNGGMGAFRTSSDIVFNGFDSQWSTDDGASAVDVGSIAIHEVGHWLGLAHACTDMTESDCLPADQAVMAPAYPGGVLRDPFADDIAGLKDMYAQDPDDNSTCTGPFRIGEVCTCDDDCANGLVCVPQQDGSQICSNTCTSDAPDCGPGFNCILGAKAEGSDGPAIGQCRKGVGGEAAPIGAVCENNGFTCGERDCTQLGAAGGERVCFGGCQEDEHCPDGYLCSGIACLLDTSTLSVACPNPMVDGGTDMPPGPCACVSSSQAMPVGGFAVLFAVGWMMARRRRATCSF